MSVQLVAFLLAVLITTRADFAYYNSNMVRIYDNTTVPTFILPLLFQPNYVCFLNSNNKAEIKYNPYNNSGTYYPSENLTVDGTGVFCTNSRDNSGNKTFVLNNAQELKVYYRPSSASVHLTLTTLTNFTSTSSRIETNTDGTVLGTINGENVAVWVEDSSAALKYRLQTIPVGAGLVNLKFCANDSKLVIATASRVELWVYNSTTRSYSQVYTTNVSLLIALLDVSGGCSIISLATTNGTVQLLFKDPEHFKYY